MNCAILGRRPIAACLLGLLFLAAASNVGAAWVNATGDLAGQPTECGDLQSIWAVPNKDLVVTGVANNGVYGTTNNGTNWKMMSPPASGAGAITVRLLQMLFDPASPNTWYVGGIYHTPGIFKTTDAGATWTGLGNIGTNDAFSVDFADPQRKTILAGGHEASNTLWKSTNAGQTWANIGGPSGGYSSFPYVIDAQTYLMGIVNTGIFRSVDAGANWTKVSSVTPTSHFTKTSAGDFYIIGSGKVVRGSSDGVTWTSTTASSYNNAAPVELPNGKIAAISSTGIAISPDKGATWKTIANPLPTAISTFWAGAGGLCYNAVAGCFYTFWWNCVFSAAVIMPTEIWRFDTLIGSTDVINPSRIARSFISPAHESNAVFDIAGRSIQHAAFSHEVGAVKGRLYIIQNSNGKIAKQLFTTK
jgi:photosystem II stability/assembly factor-like uncharacterized protein